MDTAGRRYTFPFKSKIYKKNCTPPFMNYKLVWQIQYNTKQTALSTSERIFLKLNNGGEIGTISSGLLFPPKKATRFALLFLVEIIRTETCTLPSLQNPVFLHEKAEVLCLFRAFQVNFRVCRYPIMLNSLPRESAECGMIGGFLTVRFPPRRNVATWRKRGLFIPFQAEVLRRRTSALRSFRVGRCSRVSR